MITVDSDLQEAPLERAPALPTLSPRTAPVADHAALETLGARLLAAEFPVVLADRYAEGGTAMENLVEFAELLGAPVVDMGARLNFPTNHPLNQSERRRQVIAQADLVLALEPRSDERRGGKEGVRTCRSRG